MTYHDRVFARVEHLPHMGKQAELQRWYLWNIVTQAGSRGSAAQGAAVLHFEIMSNSPWRRWLKITSDSRMMRRVWSTTYPSSLLAVVLLSGCATISPLPPVDLKAPGWNIHQGQAVWKRGANAPEIAGEILVAMRDQQAFVQFSKPPFPLVTAQKTATAWEIDAPMQNIHYTGRGKPSPRIIWLQLPFCIAGEKPARSLKWESATDHWSLRNEKTGESLEGYFSDL